MYAEQVHYCNVGSMIVQVGQQRYTGTAYNMY